MNETNLSWREIQKSKSEFLHILRILNHYYEMQGGRKHSQDEFRKLVTETNPEQVKIYVNRLGIYEYQVACTYLPESQTETWIHIDGIAEERARLTELGNTDHPVFSLVCLGDLFGEATPVEAPI